MLKTTSATLDRGARWIVVVVLVATTTLGPTSLPSVRAQIPAPASVSLLATTTSASTTTTTVTPPSASPTAEVTPMPSEAVTWMPAPPPTSTPVTGYPGPDSTPTPPGETTPPTPVITPTATVTVPLPLTATITPLGGEIAYGPFGELRLIFPAGAVTQPVSVAVAPLAQLPEPFPFSAVYQDYGVDVQINQLLDGAQVSQTDQPVTVTLQTHRLWPDLNAASVRLLALYHYDSSAQVWERLLTDGDPASGVITATLSSFSPIAVGASPQTSIGDYARPWQPNLPSHSVDTFMGAVTWRIPVEVPVGRGGLAPDLALVYNTANVDELRGTANPQTPGIGMGWSLSVPYIERVVQWDPNNLYNTPQAAKNSTGQYRIVMNGISGDLVCFSGDNPCTEFRTKDERFWKVLRKTDHPPMGGAWDGNGALSGEYWLVYSPDGTQYRFGYSRNDTDGGQYSAWFMFVQLTDDGYRIAPAIWRWNLDLTVDRYGNTIWYQYAAETRDYYVDNGSACWATWQLTGCTLLGPGPYVRGGYLSQIDWTVGGATGFNNPYQITFDVQTASNSYASQLDGWTQYETFYTKYLYKTINVRQRVGGAMTTFRQYVLNNAVDGNGVLMLNSVQVKNGDGTAALPATTFNYHAYPPYRTSSCSGSDQWTNDKVYLDTVYNGYGGSVGFNYTQPEYDSVKYWHNNGQMGAGNTQNGQTCDSAADSQSRYWMRYRIRRVQVTPGVGPASATVYEYRNSGNNGVDGGEWKYAHPQYPWQQAREFRGHPTVRVFQLDIANTAEPVVAYQDLFYYKGIPDTPGSPLADTCGQALPSDVEGVQGSLYKQISYDVGGNPLASAVTQYQLNSLSSGRRFVVARAQCQYAGAVGSSASQRRESDYETIYGNRTQQRDYASATATTPYRTLTTTYAANTSAWVVKSPIEDKTFAGTTSGSLMSQARYYYAQDAQGNLVWNTIPVSSTTAAVERVNLQGGPSAIERSWFDVYGNITRTVDALNRPITTTYDATYQQFPVSSCNALNQCSTAEYYGVNAGGAPANGGPVGQIWRAYDANGQATATQLVYDTFGRPIKVIRPGDDVYTPTVQYIYSDGPAPFKIETQQREVSGCDYCFVSTLQFYDGLGRPIQTRTEMSDGTVQSVASLSYDALGRQQRQYVPVTEAYTTTYSTPTGLFTLTQYDALGRTVAITSTDNTVVKTAYSGWQTAALDANGHQRVSIADAFGRVVTVKEYTQTFTNPDFKRGGLCHHPVRLRRARPADGRDRHQQHHHHHHLRLAGAQDRDARPGHGLVALRLRPGGQSHHPDQRPQPGAVVQV